MSITKATILTKVRERVGDGGPTYTYTNIDAEIEIILKQIASRVPGIAQTTASLSFSVGVISATLPMGFVRWRALTNSSNQPLEKISTLEELLARFTPSTTQGTANAWTIFGGKVYINPAPSGSTTLTLFYCYEDTDADAITYPDCADEAIIEGVCHLIELARGTIGTIPEKAVTHKNLFDEQIAMLTARYGDL